MIRPAADQPLDILEDGLNELRLLLDRICVVKAEIEAAAILFRGAVVYKYGLGRADMKAAVRLRGKPCDDLFYSALGEIVVDYIASMTDNYFLALYQELFPNSKNSVVFNGYFE